MLAGYNKTGVISGFVAIFLLEIVLFSAAPWPWTARVLPAFTVMLLGMACFTHRGGRRLFTVSLLSCAAATLVITVMVACGPVSALSLT